VVDECPCKVARCEAVGSSCVICPLEDEIDEPELGDPKEALELGAIDQVTFDRVEFKLAVNVVVESMQAVERGPDGESELRAALPVGHRSYSPLVRACGPA